MAEGVDRAGWNRTATLWALLANTLGRAKDGPTFTPQMIHPYFPDTIPGTGQGGSQIHLTVDNLDAWAQAMVKQYAKRK
jgi:hypothetical protein